MSENMQDTAGRALAPPRHIAIIMDGNGRWATRRGLPRTAGHKAGAETFRRIATYCKNIGVKYLTVYAFSTENWKRPEKEISGLMTLLADQYEVDLFACPQCGRVELYTAGYSRAPRRAPYWCEHCGKEREDRLCPECHQVCDLMEDHLCKQAKEASDQAAAASEPAQEERSNEPHGFRFPWQKREKPPWEG